MEQRQRASAGYSAAWIAVVVALCATLALWGARIGASFDSGPVAASPIPTATAVPGVVTVYTDLGPPDPAALCAEVSPPTKTVIVENTSGVVLSKLNCPGKTNTLTSFSTLDGGIFTPGATFTMAPADGCLFVDPSDGSQVVVSARTGSLLSEAQAANCTK
jgi:hypothetical protein